MTSEKTTEVKVDPPRVQMIQSIVDRKPKAGNQFAKLLVPNESNPDINILGISRNRIICKLFSDAVEEK